MEKKDIALKQLRAAAQHYNKKEYVCSITLSGAAEEIFGKMAKRRSGHNSRDRDLAYLKSVFEYFQGNSPSNKVLQIQLNKVRNEFKHNDEGINNWVEADFEFEAAALFVRATKNYYDAYNESPRDRIINSLFDFLTL